MQNNFNNIVHFLIVVICLIIILVAFIVTILLIYRRKQLEFYRQVDTIRSEYERSLLKTQLEIQEQTFYNISQEIHDNISLSLTLAKLNLNTLSGFRSDRYEKQIELTIELISKAISDLSNISYTLSSEIISEQGLLKALEKEIEKLKNLGCYELNFEVTGNPKYLNAQTELVIFRIIQESFNNILKHAKAKSIKLRLHYSIDNVVILIEDDGIGFYLRNGNESQNTTYSSGLKNMKNRAELIKGVFDIKSKVGLGTTTKLFVPF
jgi:two-component system, NarL family, sensor kinase